MFWKKWFDRTPSPSTTTEDPSPAEHIEIARRELDAGDIAHGLHHLSHALSADPANPAWCGLLDRYLGQVDVLSLLPQGNERYFADEAVRAYALAKRGQLDEACEILDQVFSAKPDAKYLQAWALPWLQQAPDLSAVSQRTLGAVILDCLKRYAGHGNDFYELRSAERETLAQALSIIQRYHQLPGTDPIFRSLEAILLRKTGQFQAALDLAEQLYAEEPSWQNVIVLAHARRSTEDVDAVIALLQQYVADHPTADVSVFWEIAQLAFEEWRWQEALEACNAVLAREPGHSEALPASWFCRLQLEKDPGWGRKLADAASSSAAANHYYYKLMPYTGSLPRPGDASAGILDQLMETDWQQVEETVIPVTITLTFLESPSNRLAFELFASTVGKQFKLAHKYERTITPDPRLPLHEVTHLLWRYNGTEPVKNLEPPAPEIIPHIVKLAGARYDYTLGWRHAGVVAEQLGPGAARDLLAVMIYPPPMPADGDPLVWISRIQLAAAEVIAQLDGGWEGSLRRQLLTDLMNGPLDWTVEAAAITLAHLAQLEPELATPVLSLLYERLVNTPPLTYLPLEHTLCRNILLLPGVPEKIEKQVKKRLQALLSVERD
ncbi:MAG: tetratricopeptide repeat protein [Armatimonadota bacterium]